MGLGSSPGGEARADGVGGRVDDGGVVGDPVGHPEPLDVVRGHGHDAADSEPQQREPRLRAREVAQVEAFAHLVRVRSGYRVIGLHGDRVTGLTGYRVRAKARARVRVRVRRGRSGRGLRAPSCRCAL